VPAKDLAKWFEEEHQVPVNTTIKKWNELTGMNIPLKAVVEKKVEKHPNTRCIHVFKRNGQQCTTKPRGESKLCGLHNKTSMKPKTPKPKLAYSDCNSKASDNLWKTFVVQTLASEPDYSVQDSEEYDSDLEKPYSDSDFDYDSDDSSADDDEIKVEIKVEKKKKVEESGSSEYESDEEEDEDDHNNAKYYEWLEQLETLEYDKSDSVRGYDKNGYDFNGYD
jgi:hypothetical protein